MDIRLFRDDETPLYMQAADAVRAAVAGGELRPGDRLPSVRRLSDELGVNPATVVAAYRILANEGLVEQRAGSGAYVADSAGSTGAAGSGGSPAGQGAPRPEAPRLAGPDDSDGAEGAGVIDLSSNAPPRFLYPLDDVKRFLVEAVDMDGGRAFDYERAGGYLPLRRVVAGRLSLAGGAGPDPADVHIVSGAQQGLDLVARVLLRRGDVAAVESPGYRGARDSFLAAGARVEAVAVGSGGLDLDALERLASSRPLRLAYVNPSFQNPTGALYGEAARERLARMAAAHGFFVLEDDQFGDLAFDGRSPPSVRSFDRADRVFFVKSFSKTVMPGLRIACLESPPAFRERIEAAKRAIDLSSNGLMQRVLELFLSSGSYDRHLALVRARCESAYAALAGGLGPLGAAGCSWAAPAGGINLWLRLPDGVMATRFASEAVARGCAVAPEALFRQEGGSRADGHVRVSFGSAPPESLGLAATALVQALGAARA